PPVPSFRRLLFSTFGDQTDYFLRCRTPRCRRGVLKKLAQRCDAGVTLKLRDFLQADKAAHGVAWLSARSEPVLYALGVQLDLRGLLERIIRTDQFHHTPVAGLTALNDYYTIKRFLFLSNPGQSNR